MKYIIGACFAIGFLVIIGTADKLFTDFEDDKQLCAQTFNVSLDDIVRYRMGDDVTFTDDMKCFMKCFYEKAGVLSASGVVIDNVVIREFTIGKPERTSLVKDLISRCRNLNEGKNSCEAVFKIYECFVRELIKLN